MARIIDGKQIAADLREKIAADVKKLQAGGVTPGLAVVLVGEDPASRVYVSMKEKACAAAGIFSDEHKLPAETGELELLALIDRLNKDEKIDGILVQLPLPDHIDESKVSFATRLIYVWMGDQPGDCADGRCFCRCCLRWVKICNSA